MSDPDGNNDMPVLTALSSLSLGSTVNSYECSTPAASATTTAPFTPIVNDGEAWEAFCKRVNVSSPKRINKDFGSMVREANCILQQSGLQRPSDDESQSHYTWEDLNHLQQAGMAFIINEGISDCFPLGRNSNKRIAHGVLGIDKVYGSVTTIHGKGICRDLHQFVRKRGDCITSAANWNTNFGAEKYEQFRSDHKQLWGEVVERSVESCTTFSLNPGIDPVLRFQAENSMVGAFVVSSLMIHYRQVIHPQGDAPASGATASSASTWSSIVEEKPLNQGSKQTHLSPRNLFQKMHWMRKAPGSSTLGSGPASPPASSPASCSPAHPPVTVLATDSAIETKTGPHTLNIGRHMRLNLTAQQKYETIFEGMGFGFEDVLDGLLGMSNAKAPEGGFWGFIDINLNATAEHIFNEVTEHLEHGALCTRVRIFEGYATKTSCVKEPGMVFTDNFHFVTILGVARTQNDHHGGIMFQAQDSIGDQPFKNISLELLREMNAGGVLYFIRHSTGIKMPNGSVFDIKPEDVVTAGGLKLKKSGLSRCTDGPISEDERKELQRKRELLQALVDPNYLPEWVQALRNDAAGVDADTAVEGEHEAINVVDKITVEGEASIEVQYYKE